MLSSSKLFRHRMKKRYQNIYRYGIFDIFHQNEEDLTSPIIEKRFKMILSQEV